MNELVLKTNPKNQNRYELKLQYYTQSLLSQMWLQKTFGLPLVSLRLSFFLGPSDLPL